LISLSRVFWNKAEILDPEGACEREKKAKRGREGEESIDDAPRLARRIPLEKVIEDGRKKGKRRGKKKERNVENAARVGGRLPS